MRMNSIIHSTLAYSLPLCDSKRPVSSNITHSEDAVYSLMNSKDQERDHASHRENLQSLQISLEQLYAMEDTTVKVNSIYV